MGDIPQESAAFQGRPEILKALLDSPPGRVAGVFVVTGLRGVGKSQLAAACARGRLNAGWKVVAWLDAGNRGQLLAGFSRLATKLGITDGPDDSKESAARVRNWLEEDGTECLLVLDDAVDPDLARPFLPVAGNAQVIVTSSRQALAGLGISVPVDVFTKEQAAEYLAERTGLADEPGAARVVEELGCLPLALAQAAAVIEGRRLDYATYLRRLVEIPVADYLTRIEDDPYPRGTAEAIILSVEAAEQRDAGGLCRQLLEVVSLLSPAGSPRTLLTVAAKAPDATADKALQQLAGWSLVTWSVDGSAVIAHRLVMRVVRDRSCHDQTLSVAADRAIATLLSMRPPAENAWRHVDLMEELVQQITALTDHLAPFADVLDDEAMTDFLLLRGWAGWYLTEQKDSSRAIPLLQQVVADRDRLLGPDDQATLTARGNLASALQVAGRLDEAISLHERNLADAERLRGPDDPDNLTIRNNLANAYLEAGRLDDAVQRLEQAAADAERLRGPDHSNTLIARNNLANAYREAGRLDDAIALHEQNLADRQRVFGQDHPYTLTARNNLGNAYLSAGRFDEAILLYEQNLADRRTVLGADHPDTLQARNNLANAYVSAGRVDEAIPLHEQTLADRRRVLGPDHPETLASLNILGGAYQEVGRLGDAIRMFGHARAGSRRLLGEDHPTTRKYKENLRRARQQDLSSRRDDDTSRTRPTLL